MYHKQRKLPLVVKKSNELVRTQLSVENNALANRIFATLVRNIDEDVFPIVSFPATEILIDGASGAHYKRLKTAARVLVKATVDSLSYDGAGKEIGFHFTTIFSSCVYDKGTITAKFNPDLKPHLLGLKNHFTTLNYFDLIELSSFYSQRLYELLKSWEKPAGFCEITLAALYDLVSFPKELRNNFLHFRKRALEQAEKEINTKTELSFKWEPIKEGLKVVAVRFIIGEQGKRTDKKRQNKKQEKEQLEKNSAAAERTPYWVAINECHKKHGIKYGDICKLAKPYSKKCKACAEGHHVVFYSKASLFD